MQKRVCDTLTVCVCVCVPMYIRTSLEEHVRYWKSWLFLGREVEDREGNEEDLFFSINS